MGAASRSPMSGLKKCNVIMRRSERGGRKGRGKKADKFRKTMQSWCRDREGGGREGGGNGKSSGELLHYLVPLVDADDRRARAAPLQIPILFAARNRFCIYPNEVTPQDMMF